MKKTAVINQKGGVAKTTTAYSLAGGLASRGYKVLLVDLDPQGNLSYTAKARGTEKTITDLLEGREPAENVIVTANGLDVIPASPSLATAQIKSGYALREGLKPLDLKYDYCIIDTPPSMSILTANALGTADDIVITTEADIYSLQGMGLLHDNLKAITQTANTDLKVNGILVTRYDGRANATKQLKDQIESTAKLFNTRAYSKPIRKCIALAEANLKQDHIFNYKPNSNGATDYNAFIEEYLKA